jgi:hypothetical protein
LLASCAGGTIPSAPPPSTAFQSTFIRRIVPFEVRDGAGVPYAHPFVGGLNVPRPQLVDIDADDDLDLFVQEVSGRVMFFEHEGAGSGVFGWRTDSYEDLEVGEWYRFADVDGDGDFDLLAEEPFSYIRYYRNDGTPQEARFTLAADTLKDVTGEPLFSDRQNIPNLTDIDCDGRLDLFIGRLVGTVTHYAGVALTADGIPRFRFVTDRFQEIEIISQIGSRHGANTMTFADVDQDGDQDFFWGDFFDPTLLHIENTGTCSTPVLQGEPIPFPHSNPIETSGYNAPAFGDLDGDGDLDLFVGVLGGAFNLNRTTVENFYYLAQEAGGTFVERSRRFLTSIDVGSEGIPSLADLDGDGDLDLLLANKLDPEDLRTSRIYRFENVGTSNRAVLQLSGPLDLTGQYHFAPVFGDLDDDGDLDLVLGSWRADVALYRNAGSRTRPDFVPADSALVTLTRGSNSTPALVDIDGDGDLDLFVGEASGTINFYRNAGTPRIPDFILVSDEFEGIDVGRRSFPSFVDLDADGDQDLVVGAESGRMILFRNDGSAASPLFAAPDTLTVGAPGLAAPAFADMDADGDVDVLVGTVGGGIVYYESRPPGA